LENIHMSLEQELQRNTEAMIALTAALTNTFPVVKTVEVKIDNRTKPTPAVVVEKITPVEATPVEATPVEATPTAVGYTMVAKAITDVFKVDRAKVIAALAKFGAAKGPQLKAEDYEAFLAELA
jgi:hypothetical protein